MHGRARLLRRALHSRGRDWCRLRDSNPRPPDYKGRGFAEVQPHRPGRVIRAVARQGAAACDCSRQEKPCFKGSGATVAEHSATALSAQTRAEGRSDVGFRRISLQAIACGSVHTASTEIRSRKLTSAYIAALKPNASIYDISDPAVPGLVLRVAISGSKPGCSGSSGNEKRRDPSY